MKEVDRLITLLFPEENDGSKVLDLKFFPGEQLVTVEEFCKEAHSAFVQVDAGQSNASQGFPENLSPVHVDRFLATA
ncbi:hypothetical protein P3C58_22580 [Mesorhizobium sp. XAP10]|uniref:hypothetical protein n=1 Tax=unclassified Mesorhizobium TaxID=325217 RepID=UPI0023DFE93F|nr:MULTISPECIES: hypothetical protein [unclassified Mesorhizobium]MDF3154770.1 hypothetical protein [Mesorhizobium sp. XAP10]MDF3247680.1 hypothetical protein [Mesorhizobium sp. XAP4]